MRPLRRVERVGSRLTGHEVLRTLAGSPAKPMTLLCRALLAVGLRSNRGSITPRATAHRTVRCTTDVQGVFTVAKGKRTFQPNNRRRARVHGFRLRMRTRAGRAIVSARRRKGRAELTA